jgi:dTDP-4-dehydrorhamnose 3,5-epimerase
VIIHPTKLAGAVVIEPEPLTDERGFFARTFSREEFIAVGLDGDVAQCSVSFNGVSGTLRGLHYQAEPFAEAKLVRCTQGAIYDVIVDLRPESPTFCDWVAIELSATNRLGLFVPKGLAHGFQTLSDAAEVYYQISVRYEPSSARGVRWNDPRFGIEWPAAERMISARDQAFPDFVA